MNFSSNKIIRDNLNNILEKSRNAKQSSDVKELAKMLFEAANLASNTHPHNQMLKSLVYEIENHQKVIKNEMNIREDVNVIIHNTKAVASQIGLIMDSQESIQKNDNYGSISSSSNEDLSYDDIAKKVENIGIKKANLSFQKTFVLAILAGVFISLGAIYFTFTTSQTTLSQPFTMLIGGLTFSLGLILVVIAGAELFTGNNLIVMSFVSKKITLRKLLRNWAIAYAGNFIGSVSTAAIFYMSNVWTSNDYQVGVRAIIIANNKVSHGFVESFFLGLLCNSLVCLAVWLAMSAKNVTGKILAIIFPISAFVALGFEHSVANMYFIPFALMIKDTPSLMTIIQSKTIDISHLNSFGLFSNLLPVTLGNIVGGSIFVGLVYWLVCLRNEKHDN